MQKFFDVLAAIVGVAMVSTIVAHRNTANVINAAGGFFTGSIRAATGNVKGGT